MKKGAMNYEITLHFNEHNNYHKFYISEFTGIEIHIE